MSTVKRCVVCGDTEFSTERPSNGNVEVICNRCGKFILSGTVHAILERTPRDEKGIAILSHAIRKLQDGEGNPLITTPMLNNIENNKILPEVGEQADILINLLGEECPGPGEEVHIHPLIHMSIIGAVTKTGVKFIVDYMKNDGFTTVDFYGDEHDWLRGWKCALTFKGWERYSEIQRGLADSRKMFMAMPFGNEELDRIFKDYFKPAVAQTGFDLRRLDEKPKAGLIDDRLRVEILTSRLLIAELTNENRGAYWEAGYAEGLGKPVIYTCEKEYFDKNEIHFDTNHHLTVRWDKDNIGEACEELKATIRATMPTEAILEDQ